MNKLRSTLAVKLLSNKAEQIADVHTICQNLKKQYRVKEASHTHTNT